MIRYRFGGEELPVAAASGPPDDESWWAGVYQCAARVALAATIVAASSARLAQATANPATEQPQLVSAIDADSHAYVAPSLGLPNRQPPEWGRADEFVPSALSIVDDDGPAMPAPPWVVRRVPRVFVGFDEWVIIPAVATIESGAEAGSEIAGQSTYAGALASGGESGSEIAGQETNDAAIVGGGESGVAIAGQLTSACVIESGGESGSEAAGALASVAAIEVGAEAGVSIAGGLASACAIESGGESGSEIASQLTGVATITSGAESGAVITGSLASAGTIASAGEAGVAITGGQAQAATIVCGGQAGCAINGVDEVPASFGGGLRYVERQIEAREWAAAHLSPRNALAMTPIKTESQRRPKAHHGHVKQPKMPRPLVCVIECSVDGPSCEIVAQLHSVAEIEVSVRSAAVSGRAVVSGDSREIQQVIALLALLDEVDNE